MYDRIDREAGGERAAEGVDKHVDLLAVVVSEYPVNGVAVEVRASDVAFESDVYAVLDMVAMFYTAKLPL